MTSLNVKRGYNRARDLVLRRSNEANQDRNNAELVVIKSTLEVGGSEHLLPTML